MATLQTPWQAFMAAVAEAQELHAAGAGAEVLQDPLRRARELLAVLDNALAVNRLDMPDDDRNALEQLRAKLADLAGAAVTRH